MEKKEEILRVRNLDISFETTAGVVNAVRGVNLTVNRGETVAIVGESGSGKSVSAKAIMGILAKNGTIDRGQITFSYYRNPEERVTREILQMKKEEIRPEETVIEKLRKLHNAKNEEELLAAIGSKAIVLGEADKNELKEKQTSNWKKYLTFSFGNNKEKQEEKEPQEKEKINPKQVLKLTEESLQKKYIMAECCHPIPGDDVLGYVDENDRIIIHKRQCPVAAKLKSSYGNRILATEWDTHKELSFLVYIYIKGIDSMGLLNEVTQVISRQLNVNIRKLTIETEDGIFEGKIQLWVHDVDDVKTICNNLKKIQNIKQVSRVEE